jgi:single-stranded DNA-binding protein
MQLKGIETGAEASNAVSLAGVMVSDYVFSHEVFGEGFYTFNVKVPRLSEAYDTLPVTISERIMDKAGIAEGMEIYVRGQIRSYNHYVQEENRNRLILTVFAREYGESAPGDGNPPNDVFLDGYICKPPLYRTTPFGREIADLLVAVNRSYNKSDYIPCITWGRNAKFCSKINVGEKLKLWGRMQSRIYQKKLEDGATIDKTAYEVSVAKLA